MTGKKGRSGGAHNGKRSREKADVDVHLRMTATQYRRLQAVCAALFGDRTYRISKTITRLIDEGYTTYAVPNVPVAYAEFAVSFRELWQAESSAGLPDRTLSAGFVRTTCRAATSGLSPDVLSSVAVGLCGQYPDDIREIIAFCRRRSGRAYLPADAAEYAIRAVREERLPLSRLSEDSII